MPTNGVYLSKCFGDINLNETYTLYCFCLILSIICSLCSLGREKSRENAILPGDMAGTGTSRGLGRGFDSLLPGNFDNSVLADPSERIQKLEITLIDANPDQPRQHFDLEGLKELADSIKQHGILQPLVVSPESNGRYLIIAGERRWRAAQIVKLKTVPAIARTAKELEQLELAIIENVQRVDLSSLEQAVSIERLHQQFSTPYETIAKRLGKAHTTVVNIVRLLQLPDIAKSALEARDISEGHARQILALKKQPELQIELLQLIMNNGWSVRQAERYVSAHKEGVIEAETKKQRADTETPATKALAKRLSTPVNIKRTAHGGKLEITFKDDDHLTQLLDNFSS
jgi:ParB family chromosome partitioning protein